MIVENGSCISCAHGLGTCEHDAAGKTAINCSRGAKGLVPVSNAVDKVDMFTKSDANGA